MAALCWLAVTLALSLSAGNTLAGGKKKQAENVNVNINLEVNAKKLAGFVDNILNTYKPSYTTQDGNVRNPMFSVAVSIPFYDRNQKYDFNQVHDKGDKVRESIVKCNVYVGERVVAATVLKWPDVVQQCPDARVPWIDVLEKCKNPAITWAEVKKNCPNVVAKDSADHAEYRTLQSFSSLANKPKENDLLVFYVYASPCAKRCAEESDKRNILGLITAVKKWKNYALVFSKGYDESLEEATKEAIMKFGTLIGLDHIFRCDGSPGQIHCISCNAEGDVSPNCYKNNWPSG